MKNIIKFLVLIIITSVTLSCITDDSEINTQQEANEFELQEKISNLENNINSKKVPSDNITFDKNQVKTSFNQYDNLGIEYLTFLETIKNIKSKKEIETYINENISEFSSFKFEFNDLQKNIIQSFLDNKTNDNNIITTIKEYEKFIENNFVKESDNYNNLMAFFSLNKWVSYKYIYLDKNESNEMMQREWACGHRDCFDCCMSRSIGDYNIVDWAEVVVSGGAALAWQAGSCMWDCA